jgi:hypothetical protein
MKKPGGKAAEAEPVLAAAVPAKRGGSGFLTAKSGDFADPMPLPTTANSTDVKKESNPFTDSDWRMLVYAYIGFLLRILLVCGAVFSLAQYVLQRQEKRVERTLELVDMWDRPEFQEAQRALKTRLVALNEANQGLLGSNPTESAKAVYFASIGEQLMTAEGGTMPLPEFTTHFDRIVYFLNRLATCVKSNLCDRQVADDYFLDYARSFWAYFNGYAAQVRQSGTQNFAKPIEEYVQSAAPAEPPAP